MAAKNYCLILFLILAVKTGNAVSLTTISTTPQQTTETGYFPCQSWIHFGIDDSNVLDPPYFSKQINFTTSAIGALNHPERIQAIGMWNQLATWNSGMTIQQIQDSVNGVRESGPYMLRYHFAAITNALHDLPTISYPVAAVIFISDTSDTALLAANKYFYLLKNVRITFVLVGPNADATKLTEFSNNFIYWNDLSQPMPDNWNALTSPAYGCSSFPSFPTIMPSTSLSTSPPTGSTPVPYIPCQSWIHYGIDDSNVLSGGQNIVQLNFISSAIGQINHPERIQAVGVYNQPASWNSGLTIQQIQAAVTGASQVGPYSLRNQFGNLQTNLANIQPTHYPVAAIIFISDTSDQALAGAGQFLNYLNNVQITFVLLGPNADATKLIQFATNFIYWADLSQPQPDNWDNQKFTAYGC